MSTAPPILINLSPLKLFMIKKKKSQRHMAIKIKVMAWDNHKNVAGLNGLMRSQPSPS